DHPAPVPDIIPVRGSPAVPYPDRLPIRPVVHPEVTASPAHVRTVRVERLDQPGDGRRGLSRRGRGRGTRKVRAGSSPNQEETEHSAGAHMFDLPRSPGVRSALTPDRPATMVKL